MRSSWLRRYGRVAAAEPPAGRNLDPPLGRTTSPRAQPQAACELLVLVDAGAAHEVEQRALGREVRERAAPKEERRAGARRRARPRGVRPAAGTATSVRAAGRPPTSCVRRAEASSPEPRPARSPRLQAVAGDVGGQPDGALDEGRSQHLAQACAPRPARAPARRPGRRRGPQRLVRDTDPAGTNAARLAAELGMHLVRLPGRAAVRAVALLAREPRNLGVGRGRREHDHAIDEVRAPRRQSQGDPPARRPARDPDSLDAAAVEDGGEVVRRRGHRRPLTGGERSRASVARPVDRDQPSRFAPWSRPVRSKLPAPGSTVAEHDHALLLAPPTCSGRQTRRHASTCDGRPRDGPTREPGA